MENFYWVLAILGAIPSAWLGLRFIAKRTKTKKDDALMDKVDNK